MKRFLFIGHEANRSGAPIVLLHFLRWAKANRPDWEIDLLLLRGGDLEAEYRQVSNVFVGETPGHSFIDRGLRFARRMLGADSRTLDLEPFRRRYQAVVGNTVVSLPWLEHFQRDGMTTICWVHELAGAVATFYTADEFLKVARFADRFIVPSRAVEGFLRGRGIGREMSLVYEFSEARTASADGTESIPDLPQGSFVVVGSGTIERRKGVDLFVEVAARVVRQREDIFFVWVGGDTDGSKNPEFASVTGNVERLGISDRVRFTGQLENPHGVFSDSNIFALTSREDPFPLVCLEAGTMGKPIICFADAGGIPELVEGDGGAVVPYKDVDAFAGRILHFYENRSDLERAGQALAKKIRTRFSLSASCEKLSRVLDEASSTGR
jgi:glycosyltransferase involved in cell wall biosynthesis